MLSQLGYIHSHSSSWLVQEAAAPDVDLEAAEVMDSSHHSDGPFVVDLPIKVQSDGVCTWLCEIAGMSKILCVFCCLTMPCSFMRLDVKHTDVILSLFVAWCDVRK